MNLPTKITVSRIVFIVLMLIGLFVLQCLGPNVLKAEDLLLGDTGINLVYLVLCIFFVIAASTDWLDGYLARKNNQVTDLGKFLDPVADKLLVNSIIIFLVVPSFYVINDTTSPFVQMDFPVFCAIILIARDIIVDMLRFVAAKKNVVIAANVFGKLKTVFQMVTIPLILLNDWPFRYFDNTWPEFLSVTNILIYITTFISILSGVIYVYQNRKVFSNNEQRN